MRRTPIATIALLALALTGCSLQPPAPGTPSESPAAAAPSTPAVSAACTDSLVELENADTAGEDAAIIASMNACTTVDEYIAGVEANPASWLLNDAAAVDQALILTAGCGLDATTAVCVDARSHGYID